MGGEGEEGGTGEAGGEQEKDGTGKGVGGGDAREPSTHAHVNGSSRSSSGSNGSSGARGGAEGGREPAARGGAEGGGGLQHACSTRRMAAWQHGSPLLRCRSHQNSSTIAASITESSKPRAASTGALSEADDGVG